MGIKSIGFVRQIVTGFVDKQIVNQNCYGFLLTTEFINQNRDGFLLTNIFVNQNRDGIGKNPITVSSTIFFASQIYSKIPSRSRGHRTYQKAMGLLKIPSRFRPQPEFRNAMGFRPPVLLPSTTPNIQIVNFDRPSFPVENMSSSFAMHSGDTKFCHELWLEGGFAGFWICRCRTSKVCKA